VKSISFRIPTDDLASLGLDVLVGEAGFARAPNPFVLGIMEQPEK